jgi:SpoVK/Ycf46/Vps4 family AAA+-type ATPase
VLPADQKNLIKLLIQTKGGIFQDIVRGKAGGAVILLAGPPGTGKTLTAEVYAESEQRALYSVQCSQLGTDPDKLEASLLRVFERARRWNAVMLLDEADVYVHERGSDMQQNAVVGVFLRVLEYQSSVLFLTTNRPDDVDDAIASRCIARLSIRAPSNSDAAKIWQVLSWNAGIKMDHGVIKSVVLDNPGMTGRDIKNILKLASLMPDAELGDGITEAMVDFVKQFKPTGATES